MREWFSQDKTAVGLALALGSEALAAIVLVAVLLAVGLPVADNLRWFGVCFLPPLILLRVYAKKRTHIAVTKTIITVLFATFVLYMFILLRTNSLAL